MNTLRPRTARAAVASGILAAIGLTLTLATGHVPGCEAFGTGCRIAAHYDDNGLHLGIECDEHDH